MLAGRPIWCAAVSTACTAAPSETPGATLNDTVTAGNCPWWLMTSGAVVSVNCVNALKGTWPPFAERT